MKRCRTFTGLMLAFAFGLFVAAPVGAWPSAPYPHAVPPIAAPKLTAHAALVRENTVGMTLFTQAAAMPLPPASTIKLLTALTALSIGQLDDRITAQKADLVGGSVMGLEAGDTVTLGEMLKGLLIPSGNDAAMAIARVEGAKLPDAATLGPVAAFVARMNAFGVERGLTGTRAVNPSGLDADGMTTTAADMARLAELVLADPTLAPIVRTPGATIPSAFGSYTVTNTNELLGTPGVIGVKTGTTDNAGENLVLAVNEGEHRLVIVVLGSQDRYADARALLNYARSAWSWVTLGDPKALPGLARALDAWGVTIDGRKPMVLDSGTASQLSYSLLLGAPPVPTAPATTATAASGSSTASLPASTTSATASGTVSATDTATVVSSPANVRGVIIFLVGDRELARMNLIAAPPATPGTSPGTTPTATPSA
jgi:D-alanyl-D-alanine carboxypeptidase (penicillin-binding protein 5/6)